MGACPIIELEATFLPENEGGRKQTLDLSEGGYRPHLVVQPPEIRTAVVRGNELMEDYLGVSFLPRPGAVVAGRPGHFNVELFYHPRVNYDALHPGATFTIREGGRVIGYGTVIRRN